MRPALAAGLEVEGSARDLPPGVDVTLYRLAQEALTNVLKHARGARATVVLRYGEDAVDLSVARRRREQLRRS